MNITLSKVRELADKVWVTSWFLLPALALVIFSAGGSCSWTLRLSFLSSVLIRTLTYLYLFSSWAKFNRLLLLVHPVNNTTIFQRTRGVCLLNYLSTNQLAVSQLVDSPAGTVCGLCQLNGSNLKKLHYGLLFRPTSNFPWNILASRLVCELSNLWVISLWVDQSLNVRWFVRELSGNLPF